MNIALFWRPKAFLDYAPDARKSFHCLRSIRALFLFPSFLFTLSDGIAQNNINGLVTDEAGRPLEYVNIGVPGKGSGTVSDADGRFQLNIPTALLNDSLVLTHVGYKRVTFPIKGMDAKNDFVVKMDKNEIQLSEIIISNDAPKEKKVGVKGRTPLVMTPSESYSSFDIVEHANLVKVDSSLKVMNANIFLVSSAVDSLTLRLNFYNVKEGQPGDRHLAKTTIQKFKARKGWLTFNVADSSIYIAEDFYFTIEYLPQSMKKNAKSVRVFFGSKIGGSGGYMRKCSQCDWEKNKGFSTTMYLTVLK